MEKSNYTHLVFIRQNIEDASLSLLSTYCLKRQSSSDKTKSELMFLASNIVESNGFYLSLTAHFNENKTINLKIPHHLVLLIHEASEVTREVPNVPFGFSQH